MKQVKKNFFLFGKDLTFFKAKGNVITSLEAALAASLLACVPILSSQLLARCRHILSPIIITVISLWGRQQCALPLWRESWVPANKIWGSGLTPITWQKNVCYRQACKKGTGNLGVSTGYDTGQDPQRLWSWEPWCKCRVLFWKRL